jgi:phage terminase large subunit
MPAKNSQQTTADILLQLHGDPVLFVQSVLQAEPQGWQRTALENIRDNDRVAIRSGHGVGKTAFLSWVILWWVTTHYPCKVACTANSASQLEQVLWPEIYKWMQNMPKGFQAELDFKSDKVVLKNAPDSFVVARTSRRENPEALQGFHSPNMLFIIDEASGVPDIIFEVGQGAMSTKGAKTVMVGNPTSGTGFFADAFDGGGRWTTQTVSCEDADYVDPAFIEDMKRQYGEDSNIYRVRVLGLPPESDDDSLIPRHLVEAACQREVDAMMVAPLWGLDPARYGDDRTALAKRRGNALVEPVKSWRGKDTMETVGLVLAEYEATPFMDRPSEILVDSIGIGAGVVDRLRELGMPARGVNVAESPALGTRYQKLRDELWFRCREWFEARDCSMPDQEELIHELTAARFSILSSGKFKAEGKDQMKKRGLKSPDLADAFILTFGSQAVRAAGSVNAYGYSGDLNYGNSSWIV